MLFLGVTSLLTGNALFLTLCSASNLAEALRISSLLQGPSPAKRRAASMPPRTHGHDLQPSTNCYKLSDPVQATCGCGRAAALTAPMRRRLPRWPSDLRRPPLCDCAPSLSVATCIRRQTAWSTTAPNLSTSIRAPAGRSMPRSDSDADASPEGASPRAEAAAPPEGSWPGWR